MRSNVVGLPSAADIDHKQKDPAEAGSQWAELVALQDARPSREEGCGRASDQLTPTGADGSGLFTARVLSPGTLALTVSFQALKASRFQDLNHVRKVPSLSLSRRPRVQADAALEIPSRQGNRGATQQMYGGE